MIEAVCVDPAQVKNIWPKVKDLILIAMKRGGLGSFISVEKSILCGDYLLWLAVDERELKGALVTSLEATEWDKCCFIVACGGKELDQWIGLLPKIEDFAKAEGCKSIRLFGRMGWSNVLPPEYRVKRVVMERDL